MMWPVLVTIVVLLGIWLHWCYKNQRIIMMARQLPGPPALPVIGNAIMFMVNPQEFIKVIRQLMNVYGDVIKIWLGTELNVFVSNPEDVKIILTNNRANVKGPQYKYMADILGGGILSGSGTPWRKHRKIATPNYRKRAIENYNGIVNYEIELLLQKFNRIPNGQQIDIYTYIVQTTSYIVCRAKYLEDTIHEVPSVGVGKVRGQQKSAKSAVLLFVEDFILKVLKYRQDKTRLLMYCARETLMGLTKKETMELPHLQTLIDMTHELYDIVFLRMTKWYLQIDPVFWLTKYRKRQNEGIRRICEFSTAIINHRMEKFENIKRSKKELLYDSMNSTQLSVIDRFISSQELDSTELIHETFTIFTSSQEATAKIASFLLLMMAYHPMCQEKLYQEIVRVIGRDKRPITDNDLKQMPFLEMTFKEVIRLFPIAGMMQRSITEDIAINSCTIPAGSSVVIPMYHMHRDPKYWSDPDAFKPERFSIENTKTRNPYIYIPFSLGSMDCLGRHFATKIVKSIVIRIMQNYKLITYMNYKDLKVIISISATSMDGFPVILIPRFNVKTS